MSIPEITEVKKHLDDLTKRGIVKAWELPYENILTRRSAAIFFADLASPSVGPAFEQELAKYDNFSFRDNTEKKLSGLALRITFSEEEKLKNKNAAVIS